MHEELVEAWRTNNRINLLLVGRISAAGMGCTLSKRGGRGVAGEFAHIHNNRVWQLQKRAKDLANGLVIFEPKTQPTKVALKKSLTASGDAVGIFLSDLLAGRSRRRGFKKGVYTTLAYFIAHESHHRGRILLTLKVSGETLDRETVGAIWGWDQL